MLRVPYLVFNEGYSGDVDLAAEAIRLTRQLAAAIDDPEVHELLALMLLHHAPRAARTAADGSLVPLAEHDRGRWDIALTAEETDWVQIVEWYDELVRLTDSPVVRVNRAAAVAEADGGRAGLAALASVDASLHRGRGPPAREGRRPATAARLHADAAAKAPNTAERDHLTRQAARLNTR